VAGRQVKTLSVINYTISDVFEFAEEILHLQVADDDTPVSCDVTALFTNVPLEETIQILTKKAFDGHWFNGTRITNITEVDLIELLRVTTKDQRVS